MQIPSTNTVRVAASPRPAPKLEAGEGAGPDKVNDRDGDDKAVSAPPVRSAGGATGQLVDKLI